jgi:hypothetical protein
MTYKLKMIVSQLTFVEVENFEIKLTLTIIVLGWVTSHICLIYLGPLGFTSV